MPPARFPLTGEEHGNQNEQPVFRLTLTPTPGEVPAVNRLRSALKVLLRSFGLRALEVVELPPETKEANPKKKGSNDAKDL